MPISQTGAGVDGFGMGIGYGMASGLMQLPICGTKNDGTEPCVLVRLHSPMANKMASWEINSVGTPKIPGTTDADGGGSTLLGYEITGITPVVDGTGTFLRWSVTGNYRYARNTPNQPTQPFCFGQWPGDSAGANVGVSNLPTGAMDQASIGGNPAAPIPTIYQPGVKQ